MNKIDDLIEARLAAKLDAVIESAIERRLRALLGADEAEAKPKKPGARGSKARPSTRGVTRARWGPDEVETLRRGLASGSTVNQIGRALGRSKHAIAQRCSAFGLVRGGGS